MLNLKRLKIGIIAAVFMAVLISPLLLAAPRMGRPNTPAEVPINKGAGHGDLIWLTLRSETGDEHLFIVDTGAPFTLLEKSFPWNLGKPLKSITAHSPYGEMPAQLYRAPRFYLGNTQLQIGEKVAMVDLSRVSGDLNRMASSNRRLAGVLGMDCLQNYCVQLDFMAGKMRFLDPDHLPTEDLGKAFTLTISSGSAFVRENLLGLKGAQSAIDTGCNFDGVLTPKLFQQWTNRVSSTRTTEAHFPNCLFGGSSYTNLHLTGDGPNLLGLRFLARNLVTFNFPKRTIYLKRTSIGPLAD